MTRCNPRRTLGGGPTTKLSQTERRGLKAAIKALEEMHNDLDDAAENLYNIDAPVTGGDVEMIQDDAEATAEEIQSLLDGEVRICRSSLQELLKSIWMIQRTYNDVERQVSEAVMDAEEDDSGDLYELEEAQANLMAALDPFDKAQYLVYRVLKAHRIALPKRRRRR